MTWRRGVKPTGRVWALVLPLGHSVPFVGQYESRAEMWLVDSSTARYPHSDVEWSPLPWHVQFDERTHAMEDSK
jgi:hypothetical protein